MDDDHTIFRNRIPGKTVVGSRFDIGGKPGRIASQVMDAAEGVGSKLNQPLENRRVH